MRKNPINHPLLGGNHVENPNALPQRKPNRDMTGEELLRKAVTGSHLKEKPSVWDGLTKGKKV